MTETNGSGPAPEPRCPWCSSAVPAVAERCPSCGAALREAPASDQEDIPGVTQVDPVLGIRRQLARPNRLVGWLADVDVEPPPVRDRADPAATAANRAALEGADATSVAPPSEEVRREIRRLELEALRAELEERAAEARLAALDAGVQPPAGGPTTVSPIADTADASAPTSSDAEDRAAG